MAGGRAIAVRGRVSWRIGELRFGSEKNCDLLKYVYNILVFILKKK